jgi:RNase P protein component
MDGWLEKLPGGRDIILLARPAASRATFSELQTAISSLLNRAGFTQN